MVTWGRQTERIFGILDRIVHDSTNDIDRSQSVDGIRRIVKELTPSDFIRAEADMDDEDLGDRLHTLEQDRKRLNEALRDRNATLRANAASLKAQAETIATMKRLLAEAQAQAAAQPPSQEAFYCHAQFLAIAREVRGRVHGLLKDLVAANAVLRAEDPAIRALSTTMLQEFRRTDTYPEWCIAQLRLLKPAPRKRNFVWKAEHVKFLEELYLRNTAKSNVWLAERCAAKFGHDINDDCIKGKLHGLHMAGRVPLRRRE